MRKITHLYIQVVIIIFVTKFKFSSCHCNILEFISSLQGIKASQILPKPALICFIDIVFCAIHSSFLFLVTIDYILKLLTNKS